MNTKYFNTPTKCLTFFIFPCMVYICTIQQIFHGIDGKDSQNEKYE